MKSKYSNLNVIVSSIKVVQSFFVLVFITFQQVIFIFFRFLFFHFFVFVFIFVLVTKIAARKLRLEI